MWCCRIFRLWKLHLQKKLVDKRVQKCTEIVGEVKITKIALVEYENTHKNKCSFCTLYIVSFSIIFITNIGLELVFTLFIFIIT